jgi:hypothetical protein
VTANDRTATIAAAEVVERDEPPRGRASPWQREDQPSQIRIINSLRHLAASLTTRELTERPHDHQARSGEPEARAPAAGADDTRLSDLLAAIGEDVARDSAAASQAIMQEFAGKISQARHLPRDQRRAAVAAFKRDRSAALAAVKTRAATDLASRRKAIMEAHGRPKKGGTDIAPAPK